MERLRALRSTVPKYKRTEEMSNTSMDEGDKLHIRKAHLLPQPSLPQTRSDAHIVYPRLTLPPSSLGVYERIGRPNSKAGERPMLWYRIVRTGQSTIEFDGSGVRFQDLSSATAKACRKSGPSNRAADSPIFMIARQPRAWHRSGVSLGLDPAN